MGVNTYGREEAEIATGAGMKTRCCCHNAKIVIADKLHTFAETLEQKATTNQDPKSTMAQYGKQASDLLDQAAGYVRQFDHEQADARIRAYINQSPGRSLMIAGAVGLVIGAIFRRR